MISTSPEPPKANFAWLAIYLPTAPPSRGLGATWSRARTLVSSRRRRASPRRFRGPPRNPRSPRSARSRPPSSRDIWVMAAGAGSRYVLLGEPVRRRPTMVLVPVSYSFSQSVLRPGEGRIQVGNRLRRLTTFAMMGVDGKRKINKLSDDTFILKETPEAARRWTRRQADQDRPRKDAVHEHAYHGPTPHSQFWYEIFPDGESRSRLEFTGLLLHRSEQEADQERGRADRRGRKEVRL